MNHEGIKCSKYRMPDNSVEFVHKKGIEAFNHHNFLSSQFLSSSPGPMNKERKNGTDKYYGKNYWKSVQFGRQWSDPTFNFSTFDLLSIKHND
jgi:hypothetical protein